MSECINLPYEDDEAIIGELRREIRAPKPARTVYTPEQWDQIVAAMKVDRPAPADKPVVEWELQQKAVRRVPRAWWGWIIPVCRYIDEQPAFGKLILGLLGAVAIMGVIL